MPEGQQPVVFRIAPIAYLVVPFLAFGVWPFALYGGGDSGRYFANESAGAGPAKLSPLILLFLLPLVAILYIARTATIVDGHGVRVRALFGSRRLPWQKVRGLAVTGRSVYAVLADGSVRLPCVGVQQLARVARASEGRLPEIAEPTPKFAPQRRRRR
jgi:PH (Pleckstrin Homology) domain-containing protein